MSENKKCPKCGTTMSRGVQIGFGQRPEHLFKTGDFWGDTIIPFYCEQCGYVELYTEKYLNKQKR